MAPDAVVLNLHTDAIEVICNCPDCAGLQVKKSNWYQTGKKLRGVSDVPTRRIADLDNATRQLRQLSYILDSCTISTSYEVSQAQKALLLLPREKGSSTSSDERYEEHYANLPSLPHEDYWLEY